MITITLENEDTILESNKSRWDGLTSALTHAGRMIERFWSQAVRDVFAKKADDEVSANALLRRPEPSSAAAEASLSAMPISKDVEAVLVTESMLSHLAVVKANIDAANAKIN